MRKLFASAAIAAVLVPASAMSESSDSLSIHMTGVMEDICTIQFEGGQSVQTGNVENARLRVAEDRAAVIFDLKVNNTDDPSIATEERGGIGRVARTTASFTADFFCNGDYQATIATTNGAFTNADPVFNEGDFTNQLGYRLDVTFDTDGETSNPDNLSIRANGTLGDTVGPIEGSQHDGVVTFAFQTGQNFAVGGAAKALIAGSYQEALTVSFVQDGTSPGAQFAAAPRQARFASN